MTTRNTTRDRPYDLPPSGKTPSTNRPPGGRKRRLAPRRSRRQNPDEHATMIAPPSKDRRSARGSSSLWDLARHIHDGKRVVFVTGAGLSVASGVKPFRTTNDSSHQGYSRVSSSWRNPASASASRRATSTTTRPRWRSTRTSSTARRSTR